MSADARRTERSGVQTLLRGLALLEAAAEGVHDLDRLAGHTALTRSTAHRLLSTLVRAGYLRHVPREGYHLGPRVIELGFRAHGQLHLPSLARPHLQWLDETTQETVNLAVLDGTQVVYIDKLPGRRRLQLSSFIGARLPAQSTALGKALVSGLPPAEWERHFCPGLKRTPKTIADFETFRRAVAEAARLGYALDLEENEPGIRCIASPIRDGSGAVVAAVSLSSAVVYLDDQRIEALIPLVQEAARRISHELGWGRAAGCDRGAADGPRRDGAAARRLAGEPGREQKRPA